MVASPLIRPCPLVGEESRFSLKMFYSRGTLPSSEPSTLHQQPPRLITTQEISLLTSLLRKEVTGMSGKNYHIPDTHLAWPHPSVHVHLGTLSVY